jgi:hypothetical protein
MTTDNERRRDWRGAAPVDKLAADYVAAERRREMEEAHIEGLHDEIPREFCPTCEAEGRRA